MSILQVLAETVNADEVTKQSIIKYGKNQVKVLESKLVELGFLKVSKESYNLQKQQVRVYISGDTKVVIQYFFGKTTVRVFSESAAKAKSKAKAEKDENNGSTRAFCD